MNTSNSEGTVVRFMGGTQLQADLWGAKNLNDPTIAEDAIRKSILAASATLLCLHVHKSCPGHCVSAMALLTDSHIALHTWPERSYAAVDVLARGKTDAARVMSVLIEAFQPQRYEVCSSKRGYQSSVPSYKFAIIDSQ